MVPVIELVKLSYNSPNQNQHNTDNQVERKWQQGL